MARCRTTPQTPKKTQWPLAVLCREAPGRYSPPQAKCRFSTNRGRRCVVGVSAKHAKYGGLCTARGIQHLPAAFNTYGGWGEEILDKLVEPFFNRLRAEERAATGGTEWNTLAKREFLFQCTSVAIARGNTMILNTLRQSWQQQPSANTKRGKPHRATLKAGPWDEPPQLARALATGF